MDSSGANKAAYQANAPVDKMLQPPTEPHSRPLSVMTTGTTATAQDKTGETWAMDVNKDNCWEDLILTLGTYHAWHLDRVLTRE